jgi:hypothetical protein
MTVAKLACPKCRRHVPEVCWQGVDVARCPACEAEFEQIRFPALAAARTVTYASTSRDGEANCYFHAQNRAESACEGCGRYVCSVCSVPFAGQKLCPACLEGKSERKKLPENHRVLYDRIALLLAIVPIIVWPVSVVTAPAALGVAIYGWKKPGSIVPRKRKVVFIVAGLIATAEMVGWAILLGSLWLRRR